MKSYSNELIHESSPYLQQHAHNPVQWLPWGDKALEKAKIENKPIFLSIGYSACHWCHVMEKESFMDEATADLLNAFFIPIKVDREERPDVDHIYMTALQAMSEHAGWPLSMFLTPNAEPFYGGTYFPKHDAPGIPSFTSLLKVIARTWEHDEANIVSQSKELSQHLKSELNRAFPVENVKADFLSSSLKSLEAHRDIVNGGFYSAPKFPHAFYLDLYIEYLHKEKNLEYEKHLSFSLRKMAEGGIYDHLAGGFHRYSTDSEWLVPHFEKMLYDNAILASTYLEASKIVDAEFNKSIAFEICDYVLRDMTHPLGAFYASTDADTEGVEGKFFVWTKQELREVLGENDAKLFSDFYGIEKEAYEAFDLEKGTPPHEWFAGHVLHLTDRVETLLSRYKTDTRSIKNLKEKLLNFRNTKRVLPFRDEKILTSWNGLMIQAFTKAYEQSKDFRYLNAAKNAINFLLEKSVDSDANLFATWKDGKAQHQGTLEDYAYFISALISYHRVSGDFSYLQKAKVFCEKALSLFWEEQEGSFYYTVRNAGLIIRAKNLYDQALPSSHGVMASNLYYLARFYFDQSYQDVLDHMLVNLSGFIAKVPHAVSTVIKIASRNAEDSRDLVLMNASDDLRFQVMQSMRATDILVTEKDYALSAHLEGKTSETEACLYKCHKGFCEDVLRGVKLLERILM